MMAMLGFFAFEANRRQFSTLKRRSSYTYAKVDRIHAPPEYHAIGGREEEVTLSGVVNAVEGGTDPLSSLRLMAQMKLPYPLYSGEGRFYGMYIVKEIEDDQDLILANGAPLKVSFQIRLIRVDGGLLSWLL